MAWTRDRNYYLVGANTAATWWRRWGVSSPSALHIGKPQVYYSAHGELKVPAWLSLPFSENTINGVTWAAVCNRFVTDGFLDTAAQRFSDSALSPDRCFKHVARAESNDPSRSPTDRGAAISPTFPVPSWGRFWLDSPCVFRSGGGKSSQNAYGFTKNCAIELDVVERSRPAEGAVLLSIGEGIKFYYHDNHIYARYLRRIVNQATIEEKCEFVDVDLATWVGGNSAQTYTFTFERTEVEGLLPSGQTYVVVTELLVSPERLGDNTISEPVVIMNDWTGDNPFVNAGGTTSVYVTAMRVWSNPSFDAFGDPDGDPDVNFDFSSENVLRYKDSEGRSNDALTNNTTWGHGGVGLEDGGKFGGIYIPPHVPQHDYKMVMLADNGRGAQSVLRAYSADGSNWHWSPRERPLILIDNYRMVGLDGRTTYPNGNSGAAGTQYMLDHVGAIQTPQGLRYLYWDQRLTSASENSKVWSGLLYDDDWYWQTLGILENDEHPSSTGGVGSFTKTTMLEARSGTTVLFDSGSVRLGSVMFVPSKGVYKLWYSGRDGVATEDQLGWTVGPLAGDFTGRDASKNRQQVATIAADTGIWDEHGVFGVSQEIASPGGGSNTYLFFTELTSADAWIIGSAKNSEVDDIFDTDKWEPVEEEWDHTTDNDPRGSANRIQGLHRHYIGGLTPTANLLAVSYDGLYAGTDDSTVTDRLSGSFERVWTFDYPNVRSAFESVSDDCYITNGYDRNVWWDGTTARRMSPNCTEAPAATGKAGGGNLAIQPYYWKYTFYRSADGYESEPSPVTAETQGAGETSCRVGLTDLGILNATPTLTGVDGMYIYCGVAAAGPFYRCTHAGPTSPLVEILHATTGATIRNYATDASTPEPPTDVASYTSLVTRQYHGVTFYGNRSGYPGRVYWGSGETTKKVNEGDYFDFDFEGGGAVQNLVPCNDYLLVLCERAIFAIYGNAASGFVWRKVTGDIGCVASATCINVGGPVVFLSHRGLYITNGQPNDQKCISDKVSDRLAEIPGAYLDECCCLFGDRELFFWYPHYSNINKRCLHFDFDTGAWDERTGEYGYVNAAVACQGAVDKGELLVGDSRYGFVHNLHYGSSDNGRPIVLRWETGNIALSNQPEWDVRARRIYLDMEADDGAGNVIVLSDKGRAEWRGLFNLPSSSLVFSSVYNPLLGTILPVVVGSTKSRRECSLNQYSVGRSHRVGFEAQSDRGDMKFNGFTLMFRPVRRR